MKAHAPIAPSSAAQIVQCPGSVQMQARYPETEQGPEAAEGEAAHWACEEVLHGRRIEVGQRAPNGIALTEEMAEGADLYYDDITSTLQLDQVLVEVPVTVPMVHEQHCWGTPDARGWAPGPWLFLWDYKFGHEPVEVVDNWQMLAYVSGAISATNVLDAQVNVCCRIVQPRAYHRDGPIREWRFNAAEIRAAVNILHNAARVALGPNPPTQSGPECKHCTAAHACETLQRAGLRACDVAGNITPLDLPLDAQGLELRKLRRYRKVLEAREAALEGQILARVKAGAQVSGWRIAHGAGREQWARPASEVIAIGRAMQIEVAKPPTAITPKQAIKAGMPEALVRAMSDTPRGAAQLVEDDGSKARAIFGRPIL